MKSLLLSFGFLAVATGCHPTYILEFDDLKRIASISEPALEKAVVPALPDNKNGEPSGPMHQPPKATPVLVRASRLDFANGKWLDSLRFRVPAPRPLGRLVLGSIALAAGVVFIGLAGASSADKSCEKTPPYGEYVGWHCLGRVIRTAGFGTAAFTSSAIGIALSISASVSWSPEIAE